MKSSRILSISNRKKEISVSFKFLTEANYKTNWIEQELNNWKTDNPEATPEEIAAKQIEITNSFNINTSKLNTTTSLRKVLNFNEGGNTIVMA